MAQQTRPAQTQANLTQLTQEAEVARIRRQKQDFLISKIQNKGHDIDKFAAFLNSKRENGVDVDVWQFDELEKMTNEYLYMKLQESDQEKNHQLEINKKCDIILQNIAHADQMVYKGYPNAQCATLYIECGTALMKLKDQTQDDSQFQDIIVLQIRDVAKKAQVCKQNVPRPPASSAINPYDNPATLANPYDKDKPAEEKKEESVTKSLLKYIGAAGQSIKQKTGQLAESAGTASQSAIKKSAAAAGSASQTVIQTGAEQSMLSYTGGVGASLIKPAAEMVGGVGATVIQQQTEQQMNQQVNQYSNGMIGSPYDAQVSDQRYNVPIAAAPQQQVAAPRKQPSDGLSYFMDKETASTVFTNVKQAGTIFGTIAVAAAKKGQELYKESQANSAQNNSATSNQLKNPY